MPFGSPSFGEAVAASRGPTRPAVPSSGLQAVAGLANFAQNFIQARASRNEQESQAELRRAQIQAMQSQIEPVNVNKIMTNLAGAKLLLDQMNQPQQNEMVQKSLSKQFDSQVKKTLEAAQSPAEVQVINQALQKMQGGGAQPPQRMPIQPGTPDQPGGQRLPQPSESVSQMSPQRAMQMLRLSPNEAKLFGPALNKLLGGQGTGGLAKERLELARERFDFAREREGRVARQADEKIGLSREKFAEQKSKRVASAINDIERDPILRGDVQSLERAERGLTVLTPKNEDEVIRWLELNEANFDLIRILIGGVQGVASQAERIEFNSMNKQIDKFKSFFADREVGGPDPKEVDIFKKRFRRLGLVVAKQHDARLRALVANGLLGGDLPNRETAEEIFNANRALKQSDFFIPKSRELPGLEASADDVTRLFNQAQNAMQVPGADVEAIKKKFFEKAGIQFDAIGGKRP